MEKLAQEQEELQKETEEGKRDDSALQKEQEKLNQEFDNLKKDLRDLEKQNQEEITFISLKTMYYHIMQLSVSSNKIKSRNSLVTKHRINVFNSEFCFIQMNLQSASE